ncbi:MAG: hypothetical protein U0271_21645 [Polyangiaceae bacterium]
MSRVRGLLMLSATWMACALFPNSAHAAEPSFLGPGGVLGDGQSAVFLSGDTELPGYPALEIGYRHGFFGVLDLGLETQIADVAVVARVSGKVRLWTDPRERGFLGLRVRVDFKRQKQDVTDETFRDIDDLGFVIAPEFSAAVRFGPGREHALHYLTYVYLDLDVRPDQPLFEWYYAPAMIGYEYHHPIGFHVFADAGVGWEVGNPKTYGELIPRLRLSIGWEY